MLGAITGDIVGSRFEFNNHKKIEFELFHRDCNFTDDTICTVAVAEWLMQKGSKKLPFARILQQWCRQFPYPMGGYGNRFVSWIAEKNPKPYDSFGNGSAMRIAPVGWACETLEETQLVAAEIASVSHNHPEGIKGAQSTATAIFMARNGHSKTEIRKKIELEYNYDLNRTCEEIRPVYRYNEACQQTVPEAIIAFLDSTGFEEAIRLAVSLGGDTDTLTCITGGIAEAYYGLPFDIEEKAVSYLPEKIKKVVAAFKEKYAFALDDVKYFSQIRNTPDQTWQNLFELIPEIEMTEKGGFTCWVKPDKQADGSFSFPYPIYSELVLPWIDLYQASGLMISYDWNSWLTFKGGRNKSEVDYSKYTAAEICKVFTVVVRSERFSDGAIGSFFESGDMLKCLKVLRDLIVK